MGLTAKTKKCGNKCRSPSSYLAHWKEWSSR